MQKGFYENSIVIDAVCPLLRREDATAYYKEGGVTAVCPSIVAGSGDASYALKNIAAWTRRMKTSSDLLHVKTANDILAAKEAGKLGIIFHFQGTDPIEDDLDLVDAFAELGVRMVLLAYNVKNRVGDGCAERTDGGLSHFGVKLVERMNDNGVLVDCSHIGRRTTLDAIEASRSPVVFSHSNPVRVAESPRNITDEQIRAVAKTGGLVGANAFPPFVARGGKPTMDQFVDHIAYIADLVGIDHVGLGLDYYYEQEPFVDAATAKRSYDHWISSGRWDEKTYVPPPWHMPEGLETPRGTGNICAGLLRRGFSEEDTRKVLGENWLRVFRAVWRADTQ